MRRDRVIGVVLAAGSSRRAGFPKALATLQGETFLQLSCATLSSGGCGAVYVVLGGPAIQKIRAAIPAGVGHCVNSSPERGMSSSLATALLLPRVAEADAVVVSLVDHPRVKPTTVTALIDHWQASGATLVRPTLAGRGGHPYLLSKQLFDGFLALPRGSDPRPFFAQHSVAIEVADDGVVDDTDYPEEVHAMGAEPPQG